jgi:hypothetical protein
MNNLAMKKWFLRMRAKNNMFDFLSILEAVDALLDLPYGVFKYIANVPDKRRYRNLSVCSTV